MPPEFFDKVIFITGASSGIGKATAKKFIQAGAKVAICSRSLKDLNNQTDEFNGNDRVLKLAVDVSQEGEVKQGYHEIIQKWGKLDGIFVNAGINGVWAPIDDLTAEEWDQTINVNLRGTFLTMKHGVPLLKQQGGSIVITSSVNGTRMFSNTGATAYACTKSAQATMGKMLAVELAEHCIRVNIICPGWIKTEIESSTEKRNIEHYEQMVEYPEGKVPLTHGKPGRSHQVADLVLFLCSEQASHITGTEIWIDGAQSLLQG